MVAALEIVFLILCVALAVWWFGRTSSFRAHWKSGADPRDHELPRKHRDDDPGHMPPPAGYI